VKSDLSAHNPVWRALVRLRVAANNTDPAKLLLLGYLSYMVIGSALLSLPIAQAVPVGALDTVFIASSAVSTTGLVTVDPGTSYTFFGELVLLLLCTAGFSLFPSSLEPFQADFIVVATISALSIFGAMGFLIIVDLWHTLMGRTRALGFTSKVIFRITVLFLAIGTIVVMVVEPGIAALPPEQRLMTAFFQVMTATTTVGFNTYPIGALSMAVILLMMFLMVVGASPAGTGGGLKTTSFAVLIGLVRSTLRGRDEVRFFKRRVRFGQLQTATASLTYYLGLLGVAFFCLLLTEPAADFAVLLFEALSAMGTVGLSMGVTGDLSPLGKVVVIVLMTAGRVGILTFGIALASRDESRREEQDNDLVM